MTDVRKIEIIARITEEPGNTVENSLMVWQDYGQWHEYPLTSSILSYPGLEIRLDQRRVLRDGKDVTLSKYEYGVLVFLAQHPGWLCSKEQIFVNVWHEDMEVGLGCTYGNTMTHALQNISPKDNSDGNAVFNTFGQLAGSIGTSVSAVILTLFQQNAAYSSLTDATATGIHWIFAVFLVLLILNFVFQIAAFRKATVK